MLPEENIFSTVNEAVEKFEKYAFDLVDAYELNPVIPYEKSAYIGDRVSINNDIGRRFEEIMNSAIEMNNSGSSFDLVELDDRLKEVGRKANDRFNRRTGFSSTA